MQKDRFTMSHLQATPNWKT